MTRVIASKGCFRAVTPRPCTCTVERWPTVPRERRPSHDSQTRENSWFGGGSVGGRHLCPCLQGGEFGERPSYARYYGHHPFRCKQCHTGHRHTATGRRG